MKSTVVEVESVMAAAKRQFLAENLKPGEVYAGLLLGESGAPDAHLFLLPGDAAKVTWQQAKDWAKTAGGELPTRREQRLLFANAKDAFEKAWYWSCEQHAGNSDYAWTQYFGNGDQDNILKSFAGRARAVRRLAIS